MQSEQSKNTWLPLDSRPPALPPGARLRCWFRYPSGLRPQLGYYYWDGEIQLLRDRNVVRPCCQLDLSLEQATHWQPLNEAELEELEGRACG